MADERGQRQRERGEARERRRTRVEEPFEQLDDAAGRQQGGLDLKRAVTTAAAAAFAGALAGGAKALADKRGRRAAAERDVEEHDEPRGGDDTQPEDAADVADEQGADDDEEHQAEGEHEPTDEADAPESQERHENGGGAGRTGASSSDVAEIISRAKEHVEQVLGSEAEGVSGVERANGSWRVNVEVVQMRRIPESTDILASYAVVLDGDGDLISLQETRRYRRSQADDER